MSPREPDLTDLIGPYVLGACTAEEAAEVRARMVVDAGLRREVESYAAVREALLNAPPPACVPDERVKARVMGVVREEAQLFAAAGRAEPARASESSWRHRSARVVTSRRRLGVVAALATALVALVVTGALIVGLGPGGGSSEDGRTVVVGTVLGSAAPRGHGEVVVDGDAGELRVSGFPAAGAGRTYQVWVRTGQGAPRPTPILFDVDRDGNGRAAIPARAMERTDELLLTSEPEGGSPSPTRDPVLQVVMPA